MANAEVNKNTQLVEGTNTLTVIGILQEKTLEVKTYGVDKKIAIMGNIVVKIGEDSFIKTKVFVNKFNNNGDANKNYKAYETIMAEYKSIAELGGDETLADRIEVNGKVGEGKPFLTEKGDVIVSLDYNASFVNRIKDLTKYEPKATWTVLAYVKNYIDETKMVDGEVETTGRKKMNIVVPVYGGKVFETSVILDNDDGIEWFEENVEATRTIEICCSLMNKTIKTVVSTSSGGGYGKMEDKVNTKVVNERIVQGANDPLEAFDKDEENNVAYNPALITSALAIRQQLIDKTKDGETAPKTSISSAPSTGYGTKPTPTPSLEEDDLPF